MREIAAAHREFQTDIGTREFVACSAWLAGGKGKSDAILFARQARATERVLAAIQQSKAVAGTLGSGSSPSWGSELAQLSASFVASLGNSGVFDRAVSSMNVVPLQTRVHVVTGRASGGSPEEGALKVLSEIELASGSVLAPRKAIGVVALTAELARLGGAPALALLEKQLQSATVHSTDEIFLNLLLGSTTASASTGDPWNDFTTLAEAIQTNSESTLWAVCHPTICKRLALRSTSGGQRAFPRLSPTRGGPIADDFELLVSDEIAEDVVLAFDGNALIASQGAALPHGSAEALLDLSGSVLGLWQQNLIASLVERSFGVEVLRTNGVASINSASYIQGS